MPNWREPACVAREGNDNAHPQKAQKITERSRPRRSTPQGTLLCPSAFSVDALPLRMPRALTPRVPKPKITLTTAFTDHTDDERPDSISVQSVSSVVQISVVEIFAVQNIVASDAKPPRRTQVGRSSDAKRRERSSPQVVSPTRVRMQYQNRRTVRTQNSGTPGSG